MTVDGIAVMFYLPLLKDDAIGDLRMLLKHWVSPGSSEFAGAPAFAGWLDDILVREQSRRVEGTEEPETPILPAAVWSNAEIADALRWAYLLRLKLIETDRPSAELVDQAFQHLIIAVTERLRMYEKWPP